MPNETQSQQPQQQPADRELQDPAYVLARLADVIASRKGLDPSSSYVARLLAAAPDGALKKIGEEAAEVVMACKDDDPEAIAGEAADLFYHTLVALAHHNVDLRAVYRKLQERRR